MLILFDDRREKLSTDNELFRGDNVPSRDTGVRYFMKLDRRGSKSWRKIYSINEQVQHFLKGIVTCDFFFRKDTFYFVRRVGKIPSRDIRGVYIVPLKLDQRGPKLSKRKIYFEANIKFLRRYQISGKRRTYFALI